MLPADGQIFLTSYRIIFLGTPCDPQAPSLIVARSIPVSSIYRLKKLGPAILPQPLAIATVGGLQMRSVTAEVCVCASVKVFTYEAVRVDCVVVICCCVCVGQGWSEMGKELVDRVKMIQW